MKHLPDDDYMADALNTAHCIIVDSCDTHERRRADLLQVRLSNVYCDISSADGKIGEAFDLIEVALDSQDDETMQSAIDRTDARETLEQAISELQVAAKLLLDINSDIAELCPSLILHHADEIEDELRDIRNISQNAASAARGLASDFSSERGWLQDCCESAEEFADRCDLLCATIRRSLYDACRWAHEAETKRGL